MYLVTTVAVKICFSLLSWLKCFYIDIDIFINCNWVVTRWQ